MVKLVLVLGDQLTPTLASLRAADKADDRVVMAEVIIGYMALGGLLSVFATKMARRAE